jgi:hypothetical protein
MSVAFDPTMGGLANAAIEQKEITDKRTKAEASYDVAALKPSRPAATTRIWPMGEAVPKRRHGPACRSAATLWICSRRVKNASYQTRALQAASASHAISSKCGSRGLIGSVPGAQPSRGNHSLLCFLRVLAMPSRTSLRMASARTICSA